MKNTGEKTGKKGATVTDPRSDSLTRLSVEELVMLFMKEHGEAVRALRALKGP